MTTKKKMALAVLPVALVGGLWLWAALPPTKPITPLARITPTPTPTCYQDTTKAAELIALTNIERAKAGLLPLAENPLLTEGSQLKAQDEVTSHYWAHISPSGTQPWYWFHQAGYNYVWAGENLGENFTSSASLMKGWMNSPGHRANILNPNYREIGVAVTCGLTDKETTLVVAEYGSR